MLTMPFVAIVVLALLIAVAVVAFRNMPERVERDEGTDPLEKAPMTYLQKRAWWGLGVGIVVSAALVILFISHGIMTVLETDSLRYIYTAIWLGGFILYQIVVIGNLARAGKDRSKVDERDLRILSRAPMAQRIAVILSLIVWAIALTESFRVPGAVPTDFLYLIVVSIFIIDVMAYSVGILLGYWWMDRYGQS